MLDGCRPGLAAVGARPPRARSDQADAGARRVEVHLPGRGEQGGEPVGREELGRVVRPDEHPERPVRDEGGRETRRQRTRLPVDVVAEGRARRRRRSGRPSNPPNRPSVNVERLPEEARARRCHRDTASVARKPGPSTAPIETVEPARICDGGGPATPPTVDADRHGRADERRRSRRRRRRSVQPAAGELQRRGPRLVAHHPVREPVAEVVHRAVRGDADVPVPDSAGDVLDRGHRTRPTTTSSRGHLEAVGPVLDGRRVAAPRSRPGSASGRSRCTGC